jgi:hypothetical protein
MVFPPSLQKQPTLPCNLLSDFWTPELGENKFLLCEATKFAVLYDGSPRKCILDLELRGHG